PVDEVGPCLGPLRLASERRVRASPAFDFIREDIARARRALAENAVSLDLGRRQAEQRARERRRAARREALAAREGPAWRCWDITLEGIAAGRPPRAGTLPASDAAYEEGLRVLADLAGLERAAR
ncbi:MAG: carboxy terminal-processing peptidase, partial [Elusimicrobia bacterium]|nr:carboxy terminal-processing peptidase [Elusimicrobiota bacterium]